MAHLARLCSRDPLRSAANRAPDLGGPIVRPGHGEEERAALDGDRVRAAGTQDGLADARRLRDEVSRALAVIQHLDGPVQRPGEAPRREQRDNDLRRRRHSALDVHRDDARG